jgi:hypothetical protein
VTADYLTVSGEGSDYGVISTTLLSIPIRAQAVCIAEFDGSDRHTARIRTYDQEKDRMDRFNLLNRPY